MRRISESLKWLSCCSLLVLSLLLLVFAFADERSTNPEIGPTTFEALSYQDSGYRFTTIGSDEKPPSGFEQVGFDDTGFDVGNAAFGEGEGGAIGEGFCPLQATVRTRWMRQSQLFVRRAVSIPAGATGVRVMVSVDNDIAGIFFNGTRIAGFTRHDECPVKDEFRFDVPQELVLPPCDGNTQPPNCGDNLVAFHLVDRPPSPGLENESFFDTRILYELALEQLSGIGVQHAPLVPVSDVKLLCRVDPDSERTSTTISYVVTGTKEPGKITIEQSITGALTVESLLGGQHMAQSTITSDNATMFRSPVATQKLANLDPGILSIGSVLQDQTAVERLFQCLGTPVAAGLSCEGECDLKAARESAIISVLHGFVNFGGVTRTLGSNKPYFPANFMSVDAESRALSKIETERQNCRAICGRPNLNANPDATGTRTLPFSYQIVAVANPSVTAWDAQPLPQGLTVNTSTGLISGIPTVAGTFNVKLSGANMNFTGTKTVTFTIKNPKATPFLCNDASGQSNFVRGFVGGNPQAVVYGLKGACDNPLERGIVISIRHTAVFTLAFLKPGRGFEDCLNLNPQNAVFVPGLNGLLTGADLAQVLGTTNKRLPLNPGDLRACAITDHPENTPTSLGLFITECPSPPCE